MGGSYKGTDGCTMDSTTPTKCAMVFDIVTAEGYTNGSVTACQPTANYGGGICDPDAFSASVFEELNDYRANANAVWKGLFTTVANNCDATNTMECSSDWNGDTTSTSRTFTSDKAGIEAAATAASANNVGVLEWSPGLFLAAKKQSEYLKTASSISSTHDGSTAGTRAAEYGTAGSDMTEGLFSGDDTARNVVVNMVIDDKDAGTNFRNAMNNAAIKMAGVKFEDHASFTRVGTVMLDSSFATKSDYSSCTAPSTAPTTTTPTGAVALAAGSLLALASLF